VDTVFFSNFFSSDGSIGSIGLSTTFFYTGDVNRDPDAGYFMSDDWQGFSTLNY
jgi:hypothetical protein